MGWIKIFLVSFFIFSALVYAGENEGVEQEINQQNKQNQNMESYAKAALLISNLQSHPVFERNKIPIDSNDPLDKKASSVLDDFLVLEGKKIGEIIKDKSLDFYLASTEGTQGRYPTVHEMFPFSFDYDYFHGQSFQRRMFYENTKEDEEKIFTERELCLSALRRHWDIQRKVIDINQANLAIAASIGRLSPQLNLSFNFELVPVDASKLFAGLFGFIMPYRWFGLFKNMKMLHYQRKAVIDLMLDHYSLCQVGYINASKTLWDFIIYSEFYKNVEIARKNLSLRNKTLKRANNDSLMMMINSYRRGMTESKKKLRTDQIPYLAQEGNLYFETSRITRPDKKAPLRTFFMIEPEFFENIEKAQNLDARDIWPMVEKNSYKLRMLKELRSSRVFETFETGFLGIGTVDDKASGLGITYGLDNIANAISRREEAVRVYADYQQARSSLFNTLIMGVNLYNISLEQIIYLLKWVEFAKYYLEPTLDGFLKDSDQNRLDSFYLLGQSYLDINNAYHNMLLAKATLKRLQVTPIFEIIEGIIPKDMEVNLHDQRKILMERNKMFKKRNKR